MKCLFLVFLILSSSGCCFFDSFNSKCVAKTSGSFKASKFSSPEEAEYFFWQMEKVRGRVEEAASKGRWTAEVLLETRPDLAIKELNERGFTVNRQEYDIYKVDWAPVRGSEK